MRLQLVDEIRSRMLIWINKDSPAISTRIAVTPTVVLISPFGRPAFGRRPWRSRPMPGKRVQFDDETWQALDLLARDSMKDFQELADEAFRDLLKKHGRPTDLKSALKQSLREMAAPAPEQHPAKAAASKRGSR
jgi:hypothetical protein